MKTYQQFFEDIEQRRQELRQRSREQMQRFKEKSRAYASERMKSMQKDDERKRLKDEIKSELRSEN